MNENRTPLSIRFGVTVRRYSHIMFRYARFAKFAVLGIAFASIFSAVIYANDLAAKKTEANIKIDGLLNEPGWSGAPAITDFVQFEPRYGVPSGYRTVVKVLYDRARLYFGIQCYDPDPDRISAKVTKWFIP